MENRSGQQEDLYWQMHTGIPEIRKEIAQMEGKEDGRPLTLENKRFGDQDNRTTDIDRGYALRGPQDKKDYRSLYGPGDGYQWPDKDTSFFQAVFSGRHHPGLNIRAMSETVPSDGGFLIPTQYAEKIHAVSLENEIIIPRICTAVLRRRIPPRRGPLPSMIPRFAA